MTTDSVTAGNRAPREYFGRISPLGGAEQRALRVLEHLQYVGPTQWVRLRRDVIKGDRGPSRSIRDALVSAGLMFSTGRLNNSEVYTVPDDLEKRDFSILSHLDSTPPIVLKSNTHPGKFQVRCSVCRLTKRVHDSEDDALRWFWGNHIKKARIHAYL